MADVKRKFKPRVKSVRTVPLGIRKLTRNGSKGAKVHITARDLDIIRWPMGALIALEYDMSGDVAYLYSIRRKRARSQARPGQTSAGSKPASV